jgi:predicted alpha/beta superfamily hydrolase
MALCGSFPELIGVGIGYSIDNSVDRLETSFSQIWGARARDLTPVSDKEWEERQREAMSLDHVATGEAASFIQFMKKDLIPTVESEYRADGSRRILAGHSLGGLFVLHALFHDTDLFHGYVAASPSIWEATYLKGKWQPTT